MPFVYFSNNPKNVRVGDCAVRAVSKAVGQDWTDAYNRYNGSEFYRAISCKKAHDVWRIMNDVMGMIKVTNPQIYRAIIQRISKL